MSYELADVNRNIFIYTTKMKDEILKFHLHKKMKGENREISFTQNIKEANKEISFTQEK